MKYFDIYFQSIFWEKIHGQQGSYQECESDSDISIAAANTLTGRPLQALTRGSHSQISW